MDFKIEIFIEQNWINLNWRALQRKAGALCVGLKDVEASKTKLPKILSL
jgi:hypothetical protein